MKKIILILVLIIGLSCNADGENETTNSNLIEKWNWVSTDGGIANNIHTTPVSTGKAVQLNLMKNYKYTITQNGNEVESGIYELVLEKSIYSGEMEKYIRCTPTENTPHESVVINGIIKIYETNEMTISDNYYDGIGSKFIKVE
jgi:hypothetical protein